MIPYLPSFIERLGSEFVDCHLLEREGRESETHTEKERLLRRVGVSC